MYNQHVHPPNNLQPHKYDPLQTQLGCIQAQPTRGGLDDRRMESRPNKNTIVSMDIPTGKSSDRPLVLAFTKKSHDRPNAPQNPPTTQSSEWCDSWAVPIESELCAGVHMLRLVNPPHQQGRVDRPGIPPNPPGKPPSLQFSNTPSSPTAPWTDNIRLFNKRVFCAAVGRVAAKHARRAAAQLWDMVAPRNDDNLNDLLGATNIRITVCEGYDLLLRANEPIYDLATYAPQPTNPNRRAIQCPLNASGTLGPSTNRGAV
ncbi:tegument protein VP22 [Macropodid alphaherpesvirus 1]|uniref:Tegument protein VP22 n=1 Tax=Macropodid alphaherpesvirus 1 TaxID=137443 RepID=A0A109QII1_9ALPH|nr:tegument protein VP22 [Macropodid alphaherpesvirus 1]AMB17048.1 tegument protein VP22 [Macropodid alphaherpesvirus 1]